MKKFILFGFLIALSFNLMGQTLVALPDSVFVNPGDIITINPLLNDYDTEGGELTLTGDIGFPVQLQFELIDLTDSTISFKVPDYYLGKFARITYYVGSEYSAPIIGEIWIFSNEMFEILDVN